MADEKNKRQRFVIFTVVTVNLLTAVAGMAYAWSSPSVPKLLGHDGPAHNPLPRPATLREAAWMTALHNLGALCGPLLAAPAARRLGQRRALLLCAAPQLLANAAMVFASKVGHFCAARFLLGIATGCVFSVVPGYVAGVADDAHRGRAGVVLSLSVVGAQLFVYCVAPHVTVGVFAAVCVAPSAVFLLLFGLGVPESPEYLVTRGRLREAERALVQAGRRPEELRRMLSESVEITAAAPPWGTTLRSPPVRRSFLLTLGLMFFQQFTGNGCVAAYLQPIVDSTAPPLAGRHLGAVVGAGQLLAILLVAAVADRVGRRTLLKLSYAGQAAAMGVLGAWAHLRGRGVDVGGWSWVPAAAVVTVLAAFKLGGGPVSWMVAGEVFPPAVKCYMNSLVAFEMTLFSFVVNLWFPSVWATYGLAWTAWGFAGVGLLALLFVAFVVPETRGMSLEDIQVMLGGGEDPTKV